MGIRGSGKRARGQQGSTFRPDPIRPRLDDDEQVILKSNTQTQGNGQLEGRNNKEKKNRKAVPNPSSRRGTENSYGITEGEEEFGISILSACLGTCHDSSLSQG